VVSNVTPPGVSSKIRQQGGPDMATIEIGAANLDDTVTDNDIVLATTAR
jgi:hypothetical protein